VDPPGRYSVALSREQSRSFPRNQSTTWILHWESSRLLQTSRLSCFLPQEPVDYSKPVDCLVSFIRNQSTTPKPVNSFVPFIRNQSTTPKPVDSFVPFIRNQSTGWSGHQTWLLPEIHSQPIRRHVSYLSPFDYLTNLHNLSHM